MRTEAGLLKRWRLRTVSPDDLAARDAIMRDTGVDRLVAGLVVGRGIRATTDAREFLKPRLAGLHDATLIPGIVPAAQRVARAVADKQPIVIYGDYDVDGVTASAILFHMLTLAGANVSTYVPHRIDEGYGLNSEAIRTLAREGGEGARGQGAKGAGESPSETSNEPSSPPPSAPSPLIISVDCGITAVEPARVARECGVDLIITDHHEFDPHNLPDAYALVHPRLPARDGGDAASPYPFPDLCGAGVAFKFAWHIARTICGTDKLPAEYRDLLLDLLSLAALGTVADVVPLRGENRIITAYGLGQIKRTRFAGLNALIDASRLRDEKIDSYHVGFVLGPRLNACGRMGHAKEAVHLLTRAEGDEAMRIAEFLTQENDRRRATEKSIFDEARDLVLERGFDKPDCRAIVLGKEGWHPGVVGIVASRLVEAFARPVVLLNINPSENEAHGSARSVEGVSIHEAISHCSSHLRTFGGHAMAAGLRLEATRVEAFRVALVEFVNTKLSEDELVALLDIDAECSFDQLSLPAVQAMHKLAPFGRDNPTPVLCTRNVRVERPAHRMGQQGRHLSLTLRDGDRLMRAVFWSMGDLAPRLPAGVSVDVAYEPQVSTWQGNTRVELVVRDLRLR